MTEACRFVAAGIRGRDPRRACDRVRPGILRLAAYEPSLVADADAATLRTFLRKLTRVSKTKLTPHMMQLLEDLRLRDIRLKLIARANGDRSQALSPTDVEAAEQVINDAHCDDEEPADNVRGGIAHLRAAQEFLQASAEKQAKAAGDEARAVEAKVLNRGKLKRD